jgi:murein L,D-transpeptidase YcbB/YkuD
VTYLEQAIGQYQQHRRAGRLAEVPATKKLKLGVSDPDVVALRKRLMISGDLSQDRRQSPIPSTPMSTPREAFPGAPWPAGRRRARQIHLCGDERVGAGAARPAGDQSRAPALDVGLPRRPLRHGQHPAAQIEAVENGRVVLRHTAIVGKIDRQTPILNSKINEIIVNPYWNAPESIVRKDIIPLMRKDPQVSDQEWHPHPWAGRQRDRSGDDRLEHRGGGEIPLPSGPGQDQRHGVGEDQLPEPEGVYMHDTPSQSLFNKLMRFDSSGCVRVQNVRDLVTWLLKTRPAGPPAFRSDHQERREHAGAIGADPVPVYFTYMSSAWSTGDGVVHFRDDIYADYSDRHSARRGCGVVDCRQGQDYRRR